MGKRPFIRVSDVVIQSVAYFDRKVSVTEDAFIAMENYLFLAVITNKCAALCPTGACYLKASQDLENGSFK